MNPITINRIINAPIDIVFNTTSDITEYIKAIPKIKIVEFFSSNKTGLGTHVLLKRFNLGFGSKFECCINQYIENQLLTIEAITATYTTESTWEFKPVDNHTHITAKVIIIPKTRVTNFLLKYSQKAFLKAMNKDINTIKAYCENLHTNQD